MFYESLRKLGRDVLRMPEHVDENLLERLLPTESDSKWYRGFFGDRDKWTTDSLVSHLKNMHGSSNMKLDIKHEQTLGFIVAHVRSNRYSAIEMQAIIKVWDSSPFLSLNFLPLSLPPPSPSPSPSHSPPHPCPSPPPFTCTDVQHGRAHTANLMHKGSSCPHPLLCCP